MWSKRQLVQKAFQKVGLGVDLFNVAPEDITSALDEMDSMMAEWDAKGVRLGYALPANPDDSDVDQDSGLPDYANSAVYLALAVRIAPDFGKTLSMATTAAAKGAYDAVLRVIAFPQEQQLPDTLPRGAGNKPWRYMNNNFFPTPTDSLDAGNDAEITV
jgi:hypothetical protein